MLLQAAHRWKNILVTHVCFCLCLKSASRQEVNQQISLLDADIIEIWEVCVFGGASFQCRSGMKWANIR